MMRGFILVNLFLVALVLIGAGLIFVGGTIYSWLNPPDGALGVWCAAAIALLVVLATYYLSRGLHGLIDRRINPRSKTG